MCTPKIKYTNLNEGIKISISEYRRWDAICMRVGGMGDVLKKIPTVFHTKSNFIEFLLGFDSSKYFRLHILPPFEEWNHIHDMQVQF